MASAGAERALFKRGPDRMQRGAALFASSTIRYVDGSGKVCTETPGSYLRLKKQPENPGNALTGGRDTRVVPSIKAASMRSPRPVPSLRPRGACRILTIPAPHGSATVFAGEPLRSAGSVREG